MTLSENIKQFRVQKKLTQEQLAAKLGISGQAVSKWETSETYPDGSLLVPLAQALGVSLDRLFGNELYTMEDISLRIKKLLLATPAKDRLHRVRDIGWQIEKGLFNSREKPHRQTRKAEEDCCFSRPEENRRFHRSGR